MKECKHCKLSAVCLSRGFIRTLSVTLRRSMAQAGFEGYRFSPGAIAEHGGSEELKLRLWDVWNKAIEEVVCKHRVKKVQLDVETDRDWLVFQFHLPFPGHPSSPAGGL